jgi:hypothetical protein
VRLCRRDVLVEPEDVLGVVRALDLLQPVPTGPVRSLHPRGVVVGQVVHVGRVGRVRSERLEGVFDPGDVGVVVSGVGPLADDDEVVARLPAWERGGRWGDAGDSAVDAQVARKRSALARPGSRPTVLVSAGSIWFP